MTNTKKSNETPIQFGPLFILIVIIITCAFVALVTKKLYLRIFLFLILIFIYNIFYYFNVKHKII